MDDWMTDEHKAAALEGWLSNPAAQGPQRAARWADLMSPERPPESHRCDETCVCPVHNTPLLWARSQRLHACQDPDCRYATGVENNGTEGASDV